MAGGRTDGLPAAGRQNLDAHLHGPVTLLALGLSDRFLPTPVVTVQSLQDDSFRMLVTEVRWCSRWLRMQIRATADGRVRPWRDSH